MNTEQKQNEKAVKLLEEIEACYYSKVNFKVMRDYFVQELANAERDNLQEKDPKRYDFVKKTCEMFNAQYDAVKNEYEQLIEQAKLTGVLGEEYQPGQN